MKIFYLGEDFYNEKSCWPSESPADADSTPGAPLANTEEEVLEIREILRRNYSHNVMWLRTAKAHTRRSARSG